MENRKFPRIRLKELDCVIHNGSELLAVGTPEREVYEKILDMYNELANNGFDIVIGSRYVTDGRIESWTLGRKLISKIGNGLAKSWLRLDVNDTMSGFFALKKSLITNLSFEAIGFKILLEILVKTKDPTKGSVMILNAKALKGSLSLHFLISSFPSLISMPFTLSTSRGEGK